MNLKNTAIIIIVSLFMVVCSQMVVLADTDNNIVLKEQEYSKAINDLKCINSQLETLNNNLRQVEPQYDAAKKKLFEKQMDYDKAHDTYIRAKQNADLLTVEQQNQKLKEYQEAKQVFDSVKAEFNSIETVKSEIETKIADLKLKSWQTEKDILSIKAEIYNLTIHRPVWSEGYGEAILDENKTIAGCQRLALEYATNDAIQKGGKAIFESLTIIEMFGVVDDDLKQITKVKILEHDKSGIYEQPQRILAGDLIKFSVKVRIQIQNIDDYNPFIEKINELNCQKPVFNY